MSRSDTQTIKGAALAAVPSMTQTLYHTFFNLARGTLFREVMTVIKSDEAKRFIDAWRKLPHEKQMYFYYMIMGAAFAAKESEV